MAAIKGDTEKLKGENRHLREQLRRLTEGSGKELTFTSLISSSDRQPLVQVEWGRQLVQLDLETARGVAVDLLEVVAGAEQDYGVWRFLTEQAGASEEQAASVIQALRMYREGQVPEDVEAD